MSDKTGPNGQNNRSSCKFGKQCFRRNPAHRVEMAHPGDLDYIVPDMPQPKDDAAECQYGRKCYRLNPDHFRNFRHPRNTSIQENYKKYVLKCRNRRNSDSSFDCDVGDDDPFAGDSGGSDYLPSDED